MKTHADGLFALFFHVLQWLFSGETPPTEPGDCPVAGASAGAGGTSAGAGADPGLPTPEQYCALPPEDECWPCGPAGESLLVLQLGAACTTECRDLVDTLAADCTGRCTAENKCIVRCAPVMQCSGVDPDAGDCDPACGSGSGGRVYRHIDECAPTSCNDLIHENGAWPNCHGVCISTETCKVEC